MILDMEKITSLERKVLENIRNSEYQYSSDESIIGNPVWSFSVTNEEKKLAGALGSLVKKGYAFAVKNPGEDHICGITKEGYELLND